MNHKNTYVLIFIASLFFSFYALVRCLPEPLLSCCQPAWCFILKEFWINVCKIHWSNVCCYLLKLFIEYFEFQPLVKRLPQQDLHVEIHFVHSSKAVWDLAIWMNRMLTAFCVGLGESRVLPPLGSNPPSWNILFLADFVKFKLLPLPKHLVFFSRLDRFLR